MTHSIDTDFTSDFDKCYEQAFIARANAVSLFRLQTEVNEVQEWLRLESDRLKVPIELMNQSTVFGFAYLSLVLLWEAIKQKDNKDNTRKLNDYASSIPDNFFKENLTVLVWQRSDPQSNFQLIRAIRNALSHASISLNSDEKSLKLKDINPRDDQNWCCLKFNNWINLARLAEQFFLAVEPPSGTQWNSMRH